MQPEQQQPPAGTPEPQDWQQPTPAASQAPYQAPLVVAPVEPAPAPAPAVDPAQPAQPIAPVQPLVEQTPVQPVQQPSPAVETPPVLVADATPIAPDEVTPEFDESVDPDESEDDTPLLRWQGTEYLHRERGILWFVLLAIVSLGFMALAIFAFNSPTFAVLVPVMAVALVVYAKRQPTVLNYTLSRKGLHINDRLYGYDQFKSFGVVDHNGTRSIMLVPRKRFQVGQVLYFPEEIGEQLVDMLAARLPMKEIFPDAVDRLLAKLHL